MQNAKSALVAEAAAARLAQLGLEPAPLREVVARSFHAFISCSPNHPPLVRGIWAWGEAVRALREYVLPKGRWARSDESNYSIVTNDERRIAIQVATGDDATGILELKPTTRAVKGISTLLRVVANQAQLSLFADLDAAAEDGEREDMLTWILLIHRAEGEVRCELSLPLSMGEDGRINAWSERIILDPVPVDSDLVSVSVPEGFDIDVSVQRRA